MQLPIRLMKEDPNFSSLSVLEVLLTSKRPTHGNKMDAEGGVSGGCNFMGVELRNALTVLVCLICCDRHMWLRYMLWWV